MNTKSEPTPDQTNETAFFANSLLELQAREAAIARHWAAMDRSADYAAIGEELCMICDRKLFRAPGFKSFESYLQSSRNPMSRSRADQLMRFAKARRIALQEGRPLPLNERRVRATRSRPTELDSFEERWRRVFRYLHKEFRDCPPPERGRFLETIEATARTFACEAQAQSELNQPKASVPLDQIPASRLSPFSFASAADPPAGGNTEMTPNSVTSQAQPSPLGNTTKVQTTDTAAPLRGSDQPACPATTEVDLGIGLPPNPLEPGAALERPTPRANSGSVLALTIEEALTHGYYPNRQASPTMRQASAPAHIDGPGAIPPGASQPAQTGQLRLLTQHLKPNPRQVQTQPTADILPGHSAVPTKCCWLQGMSMDEARRRGFAI